MTFLRMKAMLEEATAVAVKRVIAWQIEQEMAVQKLTKTAMAKKMHTSRAALNRLLDEASPPASRSPHWPVPPRWEDRSDLSCAPPDWFWQRLGRRYGFSV